MVGAEPHNPVGFDPEYRSARATRLACPFPTPVVVGLFQVKLEPGDDETGMPSPALPGAMAVICTTGLGSFEIAVTPVDGLLLTALVKLMADWFALLPT